MTAPENDTPAPDAPAAPAQEQPPAKPETDWQAEARKWEQRAKENKSAAEKLAELEESKKTETERLTERLTAAEQRALDAARFEVALDKGLTRSQAKRLVGSTPEELAADADALLADLGAPAPRRPQGDIGQGPRATPEVAADPKALADAVIAQRGY